MTDRRSIADVLDSEGLLFPEAAQADPDDPHPLLLWVAVALLCAFWLSVGVVFGLWLGDR